MTHPSPAILSCAPGLSLSHVQADTTAAIKWPPVTRGHASLQCTAEHALVMPLNDQRWRLPVGRFSIAEVRHGTVTRIHTTPMLAYQSEQDAAELASSLLSGLANLGFAETTPRTPQQVAEQLDGGDGALVAGLTAGFGSGALRAEVRLRRCWQPESVGASWLNLGDRTALCTVVVWDEALTGLHH